MHISNEHNESLDTEVILKGYQWGDSFRVTGFRETIELRLNEDGRPVFEYRVACRGPIQTKTGRDHATRAISMLFTEGEEKWSVLPAQIRLALRGKAALIGELRVAVEDATARALPIGG